MLREKAGLSRSDGKKELIPCIEEDECTAESDESYHEEGSTLNYHYNFEEEECWDDVNSVVTDDYVRVCTLSDEEWQGCEKVVVKRKKPVNVHRQPSYLFVDAE